MVGVTRSPVQSELDAEFEYGPSFPEGYRPGIGIVGCGEIVKTAHLPGYARYGQRVVGVYDIRREATEGVRERFGVETVFDELDELLSHPEIEIVDVATHPDVRPALVRQALAAGKHVLAQKPLAPDLQTARELVEEAERLGLMLAVNQNGRWAPAWRAATLLIEQGAIGDVVAVTHLYHHNYGFTLGTVFDEIEHLVLYDYSVHWFDITRCWLDGKTARSVRALEYRTPNQPAESSAPWGAWATIDYEDGSSALIRGVGCAETTRPRKLYWIHGSEGTMRGAVLGSGPVPGSESLELERDGRTTRFQLEGSWHTDGFAGAMGELVTAIAEQREPYNSARHNLLSLELTFAACRSAEDDGRPVAVQCAPSRGGDV
ncbi:MAG: Gfo/Idh/MocA family oxidoreductase [Actinobacteria bacterium]|nr:Gfo/Idh/MocA family oxidoreductase [Actinomycetota bacterium]